MKQDKDTGELLLHFSHAMINDLPFERNQTRKLISLFLRNEEKLRQLKAKYKRLKIKIDGLDNE